MAIIIAVIAAVIVIALLITFNVAALLQDRMSKKKERSDRHYSRTAGKA